MSAPEIRIDQLTGLRTLLAPGRAERPDAFNVPPRRPPEPDNCPFCEGREDRTPPEVWAARAGGGADTAGWSARAVPNLYPALAAGAGEDEKMAATGPAAGAADPLATSRRSGAPDLFARRPAVGAHEVVVNAPEHVTSMAEMEPQRFSGAIAAWRERMRAHAEDAAYVQLIVNEGREAGASLEHSHAQLYALPFVPATVARERERASAYHERTGGGALLTDVLVEEVRRRERLVAVSDDAALLCPWASRSPFELRVVPRGGAPRFETDSAGVTMLALAFRLLAARFDGTPQLNVWVRTAPRGAGAFTWHVDIAPRLTVKAGFELGTGVDINVYPPERAAADLRELLG